MISSGEYLNFLSIDQWTIIFNLVNTIILYHIMKKFLFKPVNKIINDRKLEIEKNYNIADKTLMDANDLKKHYEDKIKQTNIEAKEIIDEARLSATKQYDKIINEAQRQAGLLIKKANDEIEYKSKKAINDIKVQIADMAILMASQVIKNEVNKDNNKEIIDKFFDEVKTK